MSYRTSRPELLDTEQSRDLPRVQPRPQGHPTSHFDPFDLAHRLAIHQAQCREACKVPQRRVKQSSAQKTDFHTTRKISNTTSSQRYQPGNKEDNDNVIKISGTGPDSMVANLEFVRHRTLPRSGLPLHEHPKRSGQYRQVEKDGREIGFLNKPQPFKVYRGEASTRSRARPVALNVTDRARSRCGKPLSDGTYVPRNAASGLIRTTTQRFNQRGQFPGKSTRARISGLGPSKENPRVTPQEMSHRMSVLSIGLSVKTTLTSGHCTRDCADSKLGFSMDVVRMGEDEDIEHEDRYGDNIKLPANSPHAIQFPLFDNACAVSTERPRHTLRAMISNIRLLTGKMREKDGVALLEEPFVKPTISRRKPLLRMFR